MNKKIVIIGAGLSGLASAALLAKKGFNVIVLEKNDQPGGRAVKLEDKGFTYDIGPSWYMMPEVFDQYFGLFGKKTEDFYKLIKLDPSYRIFFSPEEYVDLLPDLEKNRETFEKYQKGGYEKFLQLLKRAEKLYKLALSKLVYRDYPSLLSILNGDVIKHGLKMGLLSSVHIRIAEYITSPKLQRILEFTTVFLGASPYEAPSMYNLITHADFNLGIWYPDGGIWKVSDALVKLAKEHGAEIHLNEEVNEIIVNNGKATQVKTSKGQYEADIVLSSADYHHVETQLLPESARSYSQKYWESRKMSPSAFNIFMGVNKRISKIQHHNLYLSDLWEQHFKEVRENPKWPEDPSYYVCATTKTDPSVAPEGCENLFFLVPVAPGLEDNEEIRQSMYEKVITHFESLIGESVRDSIISKNLFSVNDFRNNYNSYKGGAFGLAHTLLQTAMFRPRTKSKKVKNLYFTGQYTHPGVGMPIALIAAEIISNRIENEHLSDN